MNSPYAIELHKIFFSYQKGDSTLIDINLQIPHHQFWGIIGPNGGGKSTLIKIMIGLLQQTSGEIKINGLSPKKSYKKIGYVPQFASFQKNFPIEVFDTVLMGRLSHAPFFGSYSKIDRDQSLETLRSLGIESLKNKTIASLSGGQLQKTLIARALVSDPDILILDEPSAHIDSHSEEDLFSLLKKFQKDKTIIVVSHDLGFISHYVDRVACINRTLITDSTENLTAEKIETLYGSHLKTISHSAHDHCTYPHSKSSKKNEGSDD